MKKGNIAITKAVINQSDIDAWEDIQILVKCKNPDEMKTIVKNAELIKIDLMKMVQEDTIYSKNEIRNIQKFFIDTGRPYLSRAYNLMRRKEICRYI